ADDGRVPRGGMGAASGGGELGGRYGPAAGRPGRRGDLVAWDNARDGRQPAGRGEGRSVNTNPHQDALRSRWTLEGTIPLSGVADGAVWHRARSVATDEAVTLFIVRGEAALETADAV